MSDRPGTTVSMSFEGGQQVIRQVSEGPRLGVVQGVVRGRTTTAYHVSTGIGSVHCDSERRLRPAQHTGTRGRP